MIVLEKITARWN